MRALCHLSSTTRPAHSQRQRRRLHLSHHVATFSLSLSLSPSLEPDFGGDGLTERHVDSSFARVKYSCLLPSKLKAINYHFSFKVIKRIEQNELSGTHGCCHCRPIQTVTLFDTFGCLQTVEESRSRLFLEVDSF